MKFSVQLYSCANSGRYRWARLEAVENRITNFHVGREQILDPSDVQLRIRARRKAL
jgi:hypothetical protein